MTADRRPDASARTAASPGSSIARTSTTGLVIISMRRTCTPSTCSGLSLSRATRTRLAAVDVVGNVAVEHLVHRRPAVAERREKREQHVAPLGELEPAVLEVVDAAQLVGRQVLLRRGGLAGDAAAAELVGVLRVAVQRDVPDRAYPLETAERHGGALDDGARGRFLTGQRAGR